MNRFFITGGTGFIGSNFINYAMRKNYRVSSLKRNNSIPSIDLLEEPKWFIGDLNNYKINFFENTDIFIHFACHSTNHPYDSLSKCIYWNVNASLKIINDAYESGIRKFIVLGTCNEYGDSYETPLHKSLPLKPKYSYPTSKALSSIVFEEFARGKDINLTYLRLFQIYGHGENKNRFYPKLIQKAMNGEDLDMTDGNEIRDFTNVDHVCDSIIYEVNNYLNENFCVKHVCSGNPMTLKDFAIKHWVLNKAKGKLNFGKYRSRLGEPRISISREDQILLKLKDY